MGIGWQGSVRYKLVAAPGQRGHKRWARTGSRMQSKSCAHHPGKDASRRMADREDELRKVSFFGKAKPRGTFNQGLGSWPLPSCGTSLAPKILNQLQ